MKYGWKHAGRKAMAIYLGVVVSALTFLSCSVVAKDRYAFIIGVGDYNEKSGLPRLATPVNDAQDIQIALETLPQRLKFDVTILTDDQVKDKESFKNAFDTFLSRVRPGDDVVFYFTGYGFNFDKKNYFLLKPAKSETAFFKDLTQAEAKELDTSDKKSKRFIDFINSVALSEDYIETAINDRQPGTAIIIADASRSRTDISKGGTIEQQGLILPTGKPTKTYRLYSASEGQISLDSPEPVYRRKDLRDYKSSSEKGKRRNSIFARALVSQIQVPGLPFLVLAEQVKNKVREQALVENKDQIPDYNEEQREEEYFFWPSDPGIEQDICRWKDTQLQNLRAGIAAGALGREYIDSYYATLSRCDGFVRQQLHVLRVIDALGTGASANAATQLVDSSQLSDPQQICDADASSQADADRPPISSGKDIMRLALEAAAGGPESGKRVLEIKRIIEACDQAVSQRPRFMRFKYNAARAHYALASISSRTERAVSLARASTFNKAAADLGYSAAYNDLAVMIQNGEFYKENATDPDPANREEALRLLQRGAELGHVVAQYNLGMAYLHGDLGLGKLGKSSEGVSAKIAEEGRAASAFRWLSPAAEHNYVPAMIEAAKLLHDARGLKKINPDRAIELLSNAAYTGSWEAMYWLGFMYKRGFKSEDDSSPSQAVMWYARAAEAGHVRAQRELAQMLKDGYGVPAPQLDAAGRYYRLAAYGGFQPAMSALGDLLRDRKIPFRPPLPDAKPDGGALEIRYLYLASFALDPRAGLSLGRLYRSGFPTEQGSEAIPKDPESAIEMFYKTIERVNQADPGTSQANPQVAVESAFELVSMYDNGEAQRKDGAPLLSSADVQLLRQNYGDGGRKGYIRVKGIGEVACGYSKKEIGDFWLMVWDWDRDDPPTESQLRWLERYYQCSEKEIRQARDEGKREPKPEETGFSKSFREKIAQQYRAARDDAKRNGAKAKSFYDRMAELVTKKR